MNRFNKFEVPREDVTLQRERITRMIKKPVQDTLESKYPEAAIITDQIIQLGAIGEQIAELTKERNEKQDVAGPEVNPELEKEIADLNRKIGEWIAKEDKISEAINKIWNENRTDEKAKVKLPELSIWESDLRRIVGENWDLAKIADKSRN